MSPETVSIIALVVIFAIATVFPINMGALAFVAAFLVGTLSVGLSTEAILGSDEVAGGFPSELVLTLIGVTYLFAIAQNNGTVDLLVRGAVRLVGGHIAAMPWVMFAVTALLTAIGALSPAAVAIIAPIALTFAARHRINPLLMGMMVIHGAQGGGFSPISVYGVTVNGIVDAEGLPDSSVAVFLGSLFFNLAIALVLFLVLGGRKLIGRKVAVAEQVDEHAEAEVLAGSAGGPAGHGHGPALAPRVGGGGGGGDTDAEHPDRPQPVTVEQILTLLGLVVVAVLALVFKLDIGFVAITVAVVLALLNPKRHKGAVSQISWSTILLIAGVLTYVFVLQQAGTIDSIGEAVTGLGAPLLIALLLCYIGGVVSAFASSTAIIGVAIALAVPFLQAGEIGAVGVVVALSVSSTIVDVSPFSTNGALVLANAQDVDRDRFYKQILGYATIVVVIGPFLAWLVFVVVPGWL